MFGLSRAFLTLLIATVALHVIGLAWARVCEGSVGKSAKQQHSRKCLFILPTHRLSGRGRRDNPATRDGGIHWPQKGRTYKYLFGVHFADARPGSARSQRALGAAKEL